MRFFLSSHELSSTITLLGTLTYGDILASLTISKTLHGKPRFCQVSPKAPKLVSNTQRRTVLPGMAENIIILHLSTINGDRTTNLIPIVEAGIQTHAQPR